MCKFHIRKDLLYKKINLEFMEKNYEDKNNEKIKDFITFVTQKLNYIIVHYFSEIYDVIYEYTFIMFGTIYLLILNWQICLFSLFIYSLSIVTSIIFAKINKNIIKDKHDSYSFYLSQLNKHTNLMNDLQVDRFKMENIYIYSQKKYIQNLKKSNLINEITRYLNESFSLIREFIVLIIILMGDVELSMIFITIYLSQMLTEPFKRISTHIFSINSSKNILDDLDLVNNDYVEKKIEEINYININNLTLSYDSKYNVISDFSYSFEKSKMYLITGENGCGKSTLIKLILGYLKQKKGTIIINHKNDNEFTSMFGSYSYIQQDERLFNATIKENITLFDNKINDDLYNLLRKDFIIKKEDDYIVNVDNSNLSEGEKQVILILRSLYMNKNLIIFDETFSHLDKSIVSRLEEKLRNYKNNKIIIIVSHSVEQSNRQNYDKVLIM